jgi:hypothetical protein
MPLYTFYCQKEDGGPLSIESAELAGDHAARRWADTVLKQHASCDYVEVLDDQRLVLIARKARLWNAKRQELSEPSRC